MISQQVLSQVFWGCCCRKGGRDKIQTYYLDKTKIMPIVKDTIPSSSFFRMLKRKLFRHSINVEWVINSISVFKFAEYFAFVVFYTILIHFRTENRALK